jgi:hypothetical protein
LRKARCQRTGVRRQRSENRYQKAENIGQRVEIRGQKIDAAQPLARKATSLIEKEFLVMKFHARG